ncbi:MAG: hypothetical protein ACRC80_06255 [Waterburya sp.]
MSSYSFTDAAVKDLDDIRHVQKNDSDRNEIKNGLKKYFGEFAKYID